VRLSLSALYFTQSSTVDGVSLRTLNPIDISWGNAAACMVLKRKKRHKSTPNRPNRPFLSRFDDMAACVALQFNFAAVGCGGLIGAVDSMWYTSGLIDMLTSFLVLN
jgi:hypothetical protein